MNHMQTCLSTCKVGESSFQHHGGVVKLVQARAGLLKCQERSRKQFSPLWRCCEARTSLVCYQERSRKQFS